MTEPLASDSCVSKAFLSCRLLSSCSFRLCTSDITPLASSGLWLSFTCTQVWGKHTGRGSDCLSPPLPLTHLVPVPALYVAQGRADGGDLLQRLLQLQARVHARWRRGALRVGLLPLRHHLTRQTESGFTSWHLKKRLYDYPLLARNGERKYMGDNEAQLRGRIKWDLNGWVLIFSPPPTGEVVTR